MQTKPSLLLIAALTSLPLISAFGWSEPHLAITKAALEVLTPWQKDLLGTEGTKLGDDYCLIPDHVFTDKPNAKFATMESKPGEVYIQTLHLPSPQQADNLETLRYFMGKAVSSIQAKKIDEAARYMGTLCHVLEDFGSPSHTVPGDNQFTLLQQFLPATDAMKDQLLHGPIESGEIKVVIKDYQPTLLGTTVDEAAWRLLHRLHEGIINARSTTIPIIQALYAEDHETVVTQQLKAATMDAKVVADALHTILCLGAQKLDATEQAKTNSVAIGSFWPTEALSLYYPQTQFFGSPYWGHARSGVALEGGKKAVPIKLRIEGKAEQTFTNGISAGMGKTLTFHLPKDVYRRFTVFGGLQSGLGDKGRVEFTITGDGKPLATAIVKGTEPAHAFNVDLTGISEIQLSLTSRGLDAKSNYAIWAEPLLLK